MGILRRLGHKFLEFDAQFHAHLLERFPAAIPRIDGTLETIESLLSNPLCALLLLFVSLILGIAGVRVLTLISGVASWGIAFLWIARAKKLQTLTILTRLVTLFVVGAVLGCAIWGFGTWALKRNALENRSLEARSDHAKAKNIITPPNLEIGVMLGADKGIGHDSYVDCAKVPYSCFTQAQAKSEILRLDLGKKDWARMIFVLKNVGETKLENPSVHIESPSPVSIEFAPAPNPARLPHNVLEVPTDKQDIQPFSISNGSYDVPIDVTVPTSLDRVEIRIKVFGDNMAAHELSVKFYVLRKRPAIAPLSSKGPLGVSENPLELVEYDTLKGGVLINDSSQQIFVFGLVTRVKTTDGDDSMSFPLNMNIEPHQTREFTAGFSGSFDTLLSSTDNWQEALASAISTFKKCARPIALSPSGTSLAQVVNHYRAEGKPLPVGDATGVIRYRIGNEIKEERVPLKSILVKDRNCQP